LDQYLSISKVAELLNTTTHNIRYYEKEGLIRPLRSEKNYRMFSFKDIEVLSWILKLRSIEISISEIKALEEPYVPEKFINLLNKKTIEIGKKIQELKTVKEEMCKIIKGYDSRALGFMKRRIEKRRIIPIKSCPYKENLKETEIYAFISNLDYTVKSKDPVNIICILDLKRITYYMEVEDTYSGKEVVEIPSGEYICYRFKAEVNETFNKAYDAFVKYIKDNKLKTEATLYLSERNMLNFYYEDLHQLVHEYQIKLK